MIFFERPFEEALTASASQAATAAKEAAEAVASGLWLEAREGEGRKEFEEKVMGKIPVL